MKVQSDRARRATERLSQALKAPPEKRSQAIDNWLELATAGEVRKHWQSWMGRFPPWALRTTLAV